MKKRKRNPNTPKLWDKMLFEKNEVLLASPFYVRKIKSVIHFLRGYPGKFLDVGIGAGNLERNITKALLPIEIYGIDISAKAIIESKKSLKGLFFIANISKLPFKSSLFDCVAALDVLEHLYEKDVPGALKEINRVVKKNGGFIVSVPLNENLKNLDREGKNYSRHLREYTLSILSRELKFAGFVVLKSDYIYAFRKLFMIKSIIVKLIPGLRKPNLLIVYCKKK